jgi:hypothetical protein
MPTTGRTIGAGWFVQNGAQRVFVDLEAAPLILRLHPEGALLAHTGKAVIPRAPVLLDENGNAFLPTSDGPGMIDDRDLATFVAALRCARGDPPGEAALLAMLVGEMVAALFWQGLAVESCPPRGHRATPGIPVTPRALRGGRPLQAAIRRNLHPGC